MKKIIVSAMITVLVAGGVQAQEQPPHREGIHKGHSFGRMQHLNLTDAQKTEMKSVNDDFRKQLTELKKNEDITVREWKSKMQAIRKDHQTKVQNLLTDEQKTSIEKMKQERKSKMGKKGFYRKSRMGEGRNLDKMKTELGLTDEQVAALKQSRTENAEKFKALRENKSLTGEQKKEEMKKFREQRQQSLTSILTQEQLEKLQQKKPRRQQPVVQ